jgi:uncharacterized membrane protein (UPF0127 family)
MGSNTRRKQTLVKVLIALALVIGGLSYGYIYCIKPVATHKEVVGVFMHEGKRSPEITFEIADTPKLRAHGLMYRKELPKDRGMIFIFEEDAVQSFWMKNTYIPLDILFLTSDYRVIGILEDVPPYSLEPRTIGKSGRFVVELAAGVSREFGITSGSTLQLQP